MVNLLLNTEEINLKSLQADAVLFLDPDLIFLWTL